MPLKAAAFAAARTRDARAELTGAVNTLLLRRTGRTASTPTSAASSMRSATRASARWRRARIVGAGATATSALVALAELGAHDVQVIARRPEAAADLVRAGRRARQSRSTITPLGPATPRRRRRSRSRRSRAQRTVADAAADALAARGGLLLDAVYGHWPTASGRSLGSGGSARRPRDSGCCCTRPSLQVRIFVAGDPDVPLRDEDAVLAAMRDAVMGD